VAVRLVHLGKKGELIRFWDHRSKIKVPVSRGMQNSVLSIQVLTVQSGCYYRSDASHPGASNTDSKWISILYCRVQTPGYVPKRTRWVFSGFFGTPT